MGSAGRKNPQYAVEGGKIMAVNSSLLQWDQDLPSYLQRGPVLPQKELAVCLQAVDLLEKGRARVASIEEEAKQEFENQKKLGFEAGLNEGRAAVAAHNIKTVLATLDYYEQSKNQLVGVVISCVRRFVLDLPPEERFYQLIGKGLDELKQQPRIVLQINPQDREAVEAVMPKLQLLMPPGSKIEMRAREELAPNSCVLESPLGLVDASLESQLAILEQSLSKASQ
jgi:type III secretion protein L